MKLSELTEEWTRDAPINETNLGHEAARFLFSMQNILQSYLRLSYSYVKQSPITSTPDV